MAVDSIFKEWEISNDVATMDFLEYGKFCFFCSVYFAYNVDGGSLIDTPINPLDSYDPHDPTLSLAKVNFFYQSQQISAELHTRSIY